MKKNTLGIISCSTLALLFIVISQMFTFALAVPSAVRLVLSDDQVVAYSEESVQPFFRSQFNAFQRQMRGEQQLADQLLQDGYNQEEVLKHSPLLDSALKRDPDSISSVRDRIDKLKNDNVEIFVDHRPGEKLLYMSPALYTSFVAWSHSLGQGKIDPAELLFWSSRPESAKQAVNQYLIQQPSSILPYNRVLSILYGMKNKNTDFPIDLEEITKLYALVMFHRTSHRSRGLEVLFNLAISNGVKIDMPALLKGLDD